MNRLKKLLHHINLFDLAIISVLLAVFSAVFFFFNRKNDFVNIRVKITDQNVLYAYSSPVSWYANSFRVGDEEKDLMGNLMTRIESVEILNVDTYYKKVLLNLKVRATYDPRANTYSARGRTLAIGTSLRFTLSNVVFDAIIVENPLTKAVETTLFEKPIQVLVRGLQPSDSSWLITEPQVLQSIRIGDRIYDSNRKVLAEVTQVQLSAADTFFPNAPGSPKSLKDALITLRISGYTFNHEDYIFADLPLRSGMSLYLVFDDLTVKGTVVSIGN